MRNSNTPAKDHLEAPGQLSPLEQAVDDWDSIYEEAAIAHNPFEVLGLDPLLADLSPDATGILSEPVWSAVFATQDLVDHLGIGSADNPEVYERHLLNVICRNMLELDLFSNKEKFVPFSNHTERADLRLVLVVKNKFKPPAAVIGLAANFRPTERENNMDKSWLLVFTIDQIQYFPTHVCPQCGAKPVRLACGELYEPFRNLFGAFLEYDAYFGYVKFDCSCHLNLSSETDPQLAGSLRVARVGDALLPISFVSSYSADLATWGMHAADVNNARVRQAVQFLAASADQQAMTGSDALKTLVYGVSAGLPPETAYEALKALLLRSGAAIGLPVNVLVDVEVQ